MNRARWITLALALGALALGMAVVPQADAAPLRNAKAKPGDCVACHKAEKVLPAGHVATREMKLDACAQCHAAKSPTALAGRMPGSHLHALRGIDCASCHGKVKKPKAVEMDKCTTCHDPAAMAQKTASTAHANPHDSKHWGTELDCNLCHHQHAKSEDYCAQCHRFGFKVP
jgi:hypothetical protein